MDGSAAERPCGQCGELLVHDERWDATFCPVCNEWREGKCGDPYCSYCRKRPDRPLP